MNEHPIEGLMVTAMNSIQDMVDVNTIIGDPIETANNVVIIPISKVSFGFAAGGSEFKGETVNEYSRKEEEEQVQYRLPFGGGSGAGVNINPIAFLVVQAGNVKLLPVNHSSAVDKLLDYMPDAIDKINGIINKQIQIKSEEKMKRQEAREPLHQKEPEKETKQEKKTTTTVTKTRPRRGRSKAVDTFEYEYNEVPAAEDILITADDTEDFDD
ncbi:MAG: sporulation protein YtfJ [Clostridia bacterium]|nr:sporulation protein YtfJ [Clostridia bacterium]